MLGLEQARPGVSQDGIIPLELGNLKIMSIGFLLQDQDDAVILRGPAKIGIIQQFLRDVVWGELDYLIIDSPPGTGDEPLSVIQTIGDVQGAIVVTTPQQRRLCGCPQILSLFAEMLDVPILRRCREHEHVCLPALRPGHRHLFSRRRARNLGDDGRTVPGLDPSGPKHHERGRCRECHSWTATQPPPLPK